MTPHRYERCSPRRRVAPVLSERAGAVEHPPTVTREQLSAAVLAVDAIARALCELDEDVALRVMATALRDDRLREGSIPRTAILVVLNRRMEIARQRKEGQAPADK